MTSKLIISAYTLLFISSLAHAGQFKEELLSPVTTDAQTPFLIGTSLTLVTSAFKHNIDEPFQESTVRNKPLGHWSHYGDLMGQMIPNALYVGGMGLHGWLAESQGSSNSALLMIKATAYSGIVTNLLKYTTRETRPSGHSQTSFPSGHTTVAFAFSSVVGALHGWKWGVPAYALATFVGYSRINDNAHWLNDVLGGATIGIGYGLGLTYLQKKKSTNQVQFFPTPIRGGYAMNLTYRY